MTREEAWLLEEKYAGEETAEYEADVARLAEGEPLGYVIGYQPFLGLKIYLDSKPLIPRPETEWWVERLLAQALTRPKDAMPLRVLDLCAGSGAIGCAVLAGLPTARVSFGELDPAHEATILKNIRENNLDESRATIGIGDLFEPFDSDMRFDIIAANPPYVPAARTLPSSVALHEPAMALFSGDDGLAVTRRIAEELPKRLAPGGAAWIECDRGHAEAARALFEAQGFSAEIHTDQYDKPRFIVVSFSV